MTTVIARELRGAAGDLAEVGRLVLACSAASLRRRFWLGGEPDPAEILARYQRFFLAGPPDGVALLALVDGTPAGLLNLVPDTTPRLAELGVLVADPWQRRGLGNGLTGWLRRSGRWRGWTVHASVQDNNGAAIALLRRHGFRRLPPAEPGQHDYDLVLREEAHAEVTA
ncbi:GNAT family N-acetyltransferase [Amycolatopsis sp. K13G38]|uniref:GNAT family N-acetyltransferase n=1 Tax=Amycolatopsis acididurans TaxID=2724524 RepID=A0ABX1JHN2_9PSEU|nr:GNAT family N-acetyltransferase [Amycolatopsis acididurans]NKQ59297.1 GNAT family N-acetyltransferase [Amycolatopsis acididurans]